MKSNHLIRKTKFVRTLLILLFMAVPMQWAVAQLTLSTPRTTLGIVIKQIQSQSKYQFFYSDKLSSVTVDALQVKDASLTNVLNRLLKGKNISYKVEENIVYLSDKEESQVPQQQVGKERTVSGNVVDSKGEPLIGVSVLIKGTTSGSITDFDGNYKVSTNETNPIIVFSYIGYKSQEIPLNGQTSINVILQDDTQVIEEVVVTALGIKRERKALGYSIGEVKGEELEKAKETNVINSLAGKIPGLVISQTAGGPSGSSRVIVRGSTEMTGNNQPLYVVDGVPLDNSNYGSAGTYGGYDLGDGISSINPDDIEKIDVLKDASATAIYGSSGANGVIIVTNKRGRKQIPKRNLQWN